VSTLSKIKWVITVDVRDGGTLYVRPKDMLTRVQAKETVVLILKNGIWEDDVYYPPSCFNFAQLNEAKKVQS
jgi:hypothetical protein